MIILDLYQNPDHSLIPNIRVLQIKPLEFYSMVCGLERLTSTSWKKGTHHIQQNSTNVDYPNLHNKQNIPFMNMWCALQWTTMPEDHSITRLTQLNGAIRLPQQHTPLCMWVKMP